MGKVGMLIERLDNYRLEHRISQEKLAEVLGVTFVTVNRWFNGHSQPNKIQAYHIRKLLTSEKSKK
jgi:transcriptional regulator with XRE-family HTH domain